jgi:hypothetical protein
VQPQFGQSIVPNDLKPVLQVAAGVAHTLVLEMPPAIDTDGDGRPDPFDNCAVVYNPDQADCNEDNVGDACEIAAGAADIDRNGIPDNCECIADLVLADRQVNGADLGALLSQWGPANASTVSDINRDGRVDGADLGYLLSNWGPCPN